MSQLAIKSTKHAHPSGYLGSVMRLTVNRCFIFWFMDEKGLLICQMFRYGLRPHCSDMGNAKNSRKLVIYVMWWSIVIWLIEFQLDSWCCLPVNCNFNPFFIFIYSDLPWCCLHGKKARWFDRWFRWLSWKGNQASIYSFIYIFIYVHLYLYTYLFIIYFYF